MASDAKLYTIEVLNENKDGLSQEFIGEYETENISLLEKFLQLSAPQELRVGLAKSRGFGAIELKIEDGPGVWNNLDKENLEERLIELNDKINHHGCFFTITLHSDVILFDDLLRYKSIIDPSDLNLQADYNFKLLRGWTAVNSVMGWNSVLKLPKEDEAAIAKGSVFLFYTDKELNEDERSSLINGLKTIETEGIGVRKNEGFGRIRICDEWHLKEYK